MSKGNGPILNRELGYGLAAVRHRSGLALAGWSILELPSAALSGLCVAKALDDGFIRHRPIIGLAWISTLLIAYAFAALALKLEFRALGDLVEPLRDDLVCRVVSDALARAAAGERDSGATARLTRQVETVRDAFAGLLVALRGFTVAAVGTAAGMLVLNPLIALVLLPPFLLGVGLFVAVLGVAAGRQRACVIADEQVAVTAGTILTAVRDLTACGAEQYAADLAATSIEAQARAERAMAAVTALRSLCFAVGGWLPLVALLAAGPTLMRHGLTAGGLVGGLTFVVSGLQPALRTVMTGLGDSGLRYSVTLARILDAAAPEDRPRTAGAPAGHELALRDVTFAYGPASEPVLDGLDLSVPAEDHLAIVGPSGVGKSTLAALICGLRRPDAGQVLIGGTPACDLSPSDLAALRVLIPQEAYVFAGTVRENLVYLEPTATTARIDQAVSRLGASDLLDRLGGLDARLEPEKLSAGERQLLTLVRAYLSPAPLAVLDEATCHLDPIAERRAEEAFADRDGTVIVIAHRLSSALRARRVLVLDGTHAVLGSHSELMASSPLYRDLLGHWSGPATSGAASDPSLVPGDLHRLEPAARAGLGDGP